MRYRGFLKKEGLAAIESWIEAEEDTWVGIGFGIAGAEGGYISFCDYGPPEGEDLQSVLTSARRIRTHLGQFIEAAEKALAPPAVAERQAREGGEL
jgi:hypothetical protein